MNVNDDDDAPYALYYIILRLIFVSNAAIQNECSIIMHFPMFKYNMYII